MTTNYPLDQAEIDELGDLLVADIVPETCMDISMLDGYLAAIALNPLQPNRSEWLPWVWDMIDGQSTPRFDNEQAAEHYIGLIRRHFYALRDAISNGEFEPILFEDDDAVDGDTPQSANDEESELVDEPAMDASNWCDGFMLGVSLFPQAWQSLLETQIEMLNPMVLLGTDEGRALLEENGDDSQDIIDQAAEAIPEVIQILNRHFQAARQKAAVKKSAKTSTQNKRKK